MFKKFPKTRNILKKHFQGRDNSGNTFSQHPVPHPPTTLSWQQGREPPPSFSLPPPIQKHPRTAKAAGLRRPFLQAAPTSCLISPPPLLFQNENSTQGEKRKRASNERFFHPPPSRTVHCAHVRLLLLWPLMWSRR